MGEGPEKRAAHNTGARQAPTQASPHSCHHAEMSPLKESIVPLGFRGITVSWHSEAIPQRDLPSSITTSPCQQRKWARGGERWVIPSTYQVPDVCGNTEARVKWLARGHSADGRQRQGLDPSAAGPRAKLSPSTRPDSRLPEPHSAGGAVATTAALQGVRAEPCWGPGV